jgi:hypothetical protein
LSRSIRLFGPLSTAPAEDSQFTGSADNDDDIRKSVPLRGSWPAVLSLAAAAPVWLLFVEK